MHDPALALTRAEWWALLPAEARAFLRECNEKLGPVEFVAAWKTEASDG